MLVFTRPYLGVVLGIFVLTSSLSGQSFGSEASKRSALSGAVVTDSGDPLEGARVFVYTARPKEGPGVLCPSCYPDCVKNAETAADGTFTIPDVDPALFFRLLVASPGYRPEFVNDVDPSGDPVKTTLKRRADGDSPQKRVEGRVVTAEARPVEGAVVTIRGVTRGSGTQFGGNTEVDPLAVTDANGRFVIHSEEEFDAIGVDVEARALAKGVFERLSSGEKIHELVLNEGASVTGRVMDGDKPLAGVEIGISGTDRSSDAFVGYFSVATDEDGRFLFVNLPAKTSYQLCGLMNSTGSRGTIPVRTVQVGEVGSTLEVGELKVEKGFMVAGELQLTDGGELPDKMRVLLGREDAWDTLQVEVDKDGRFRFEGVPAEKVTISARVKGYRMSLANANLDPWNPFHLVGTVFGNKTNLVLQFEPGEPHRRLTGDGHALRQEPIQGAEQPDHTGDIEVTGTVTDAETGEPLPSFTVVEGRVMQHNPNEVGWYQSRKHEFKDGKFVVYFRKLSQLPAVSVEADGYLPFASSGVASAKTNFAIALVKGTGPGGIVLTPDGSPLANASVYLTDMRNGVYMGEGGTVHEQMNSGTRKTTTDEAGRFRFPPQVDAYGIVVVHDDGYAQLSVDDLKEQERVQLRSWATVQGQLRIGSKPGAKEQIRLGLAHIPYEHHPRNFPPLQLHLQTTTDDSGHFTFDRVPPIAVEVSHSPKVRDDPMGIIPQSQNTRLQLNPGETHELMLGGKGRAVIGRLVLTGHEGKINWREDVQTLSLIVADPPDLPSFGGLGEEFREMMSAAKTEEEKQEIQRRIQARQQEIQEGMRKFYQSEAGREHAFASKTYALNFSEDGSFRVEDVPGGKYRLNIELRDYEGAGHNRFSAPVVAHLNREIEVPDSAGGRSDESHDLGTIEVAARMVMKPGVVAPDFEVTTLDDRKIKLSDYKGKYVLLDFWAVWCGPCVGETPFLKETYASFKDDPRFVMIGLSLDPKESAPRDYVQKNDLGWIQGFLGEWSKTDLPTRYGVDGIPAIMLIGPDGKIVANNLRGAAIQNAVSSALEAR